jgi:hypothetical protein
MGPFPFHHVHRFEEPLMASATGDRNLLFGILALQMDFIARDALVKAMHAWVLDKAKPLGQILVEQQALKSERRALLEALVQEHVKQHDDDPDLAVPSRLRTWIICQHHQDVTGARRQDRCSSHVDR